MILAVVLPTMCYHTGKERHLISHSCDELHSEQTLQVAWGKNMRS